MNNSDSTITTQYAKCNAQLVGDFDVQVDWQVNSATNPTSSHHYMYMQVLYAGGGSAYIARTRKYDGSPRYIANPPTEEKTGTADVGPGKFRITRVGTVTKVYYWHDSQWEWEGSTAGYTTSTTTTGNASVYLRYIRRDAATWDVSWDNLVVNSSDGIVTAKSDVNKQKIAVTAADGVTQYLAEIDYWDAQEEVATIWTKLTTVTSGINTQLYLYYESTQTDNTDYIADAPTAASGIWDSNYTGVWHMSQRPFVGATDTILESTSNNFHATPSGSMNVGDFRISQIGRSIEFDGIDEYITVVSDSAFGGGSITIETTVKTDQSATAQLVSRDDNPDERVWQFKKNDAGNLEFVVFKTDSQSVTVTGTTNISDDVHHGLVGTWDGTTVKVYIDGIEENSTVFSGTLNTATSNVLFGAAETDVPGYFDGTIDDVRISNVARSGNWLRTAYQSDVDNLFSFDDAEYNVGISKVGDVTFPAVGEATLYGEISSDNHDGYVSVYYGAADGGTSFLSWDSSVSLGLQTSDSGFDVTLSGLAPFSTYYYRWYTTYSGSEPSEEWTPSYYFYTPQGQILKGTSNDFIAITAEPDSTFYNTHFATVSHGEGAGLNIVEDDVVRLFWPSTVSGTGNTIRQDCSDLVSVR